MSKNRIKIPLPNIKTRDEAEAVMNELALTANNKRKFTARMDAQILAAQEAVAPDIAACDEAIKAKSDALRAWAEAHPEEFPKGRKSIEFLSGILGFRTGTPKLALLSRAFTWDKVLELIQHFGFQFTRQKLEVDKEAILAFAAEEQDKVRLEARVLRPIGLKVVQDEGFYIEPKLTETDDTVKAAA